MLYCKIAKLTLLAVIFSLAVFGVWLPISHAQNDDRPCVTDYDFSLGVIRWIGGEWVSGDGYMYSADLGGDNYSLSALGAAFFIADSGAITSTLISTNGVMTVTSRVSGSGRDVAFGYCRPGGGGCYFLNDRTNTDWVSWVLNFPANEQIEFFFVDCQGPSGGQCDVSRIEISLPYCQAANQDGGATCATVMDANFSGLISNTWLLDGSAVINDMLILGPGDVAAQNLTLESLTTYNAVISSTTETAEPTEIIVSLGTITRTVEITGAGRFTTSFTTSNLFGPIEYRLAKETTGDVFIDFTCLYLGDGEKSCLAPENGTFDTAQNWQWYRNAYWEEFSQMAALPYNGVDEDFSMSLVQTSRAYSMPTLLEGEYLILGFQAQSSDQFGLINSRIGSVEIERQVYNRPYDYEIDISHLADTDADIAFADGGTNDLLLDNVCVFISNDPPHSPKASDPEGIPGVDFNFNYTCRDVPALLAGFGINVYSLQVTYEAGVSVWEPQNYIPWLAAALWSNAAHPITCFIVEEMRLIAGVAQQQINEFLNFVSWTVRSSNAVAPWLQSGFTYLKNATFNPAVAMRTTASGWLPWWSNNIRSLLNTIGTNWAITIDWIREAAIYISDASLGSDLEDELPGIGPGWGMLEMLWAFVDLVWWLWNWIWNNVIMMASVPLEFWTAFNEGIAAEPFADLVTCSGGNFWCIFLSGVQLVNQTVSDTILYPAVIILSVLATFMILWDDFWKMVNIDVR